MLTILQGENELARQEALSDILQKTHMTVDLKALNTETHEGTPTLGELRQACSTLPFLGDTRVIIYYDALTEVKGSLGKEIAAYLLELPPTTHLIFVESRMLPAKHTVVVWAKENDGNVKSFTVPKPKDLTGWIIERTEKYGGVIESRAAALLAQNLGTRLRLLDQEIRKLMIYCGEGHAITTEDVRTMVPYVQSADVIFDMVDALGQRNPHNAVIYLHRMLGTGDHPLYVMTMVVRQFRLLIQTRWLIDQHYTVRDIANRLQQHPYVAQKLYSQALRFTLEQLRAAYTLLLKMDLGIKTGEIEAVTALDLLVAKLTRL
jgi:DNA polymerase-3 subunit delta